MSEPTVAEVQEYARRRYGINVHPGTRLYQNMAEMCGLGRRYRRLSSDRSLPNGVRAVLRGNAALLGEL